ncbi:MAG: peptidylprolyl isomerase [candidate division Zixibacteria bacterium]|nr:peptidylprolyl isomerase [candidate division Zixibacteria bacterium]
MPEVYEMLLNSQEIPLGGTLERSQVKRFLDSVVCESLTGIAGNELILEDYYNVYRTFRRPYHDLLIKEWVREVIYDRIELDSVEVAEYYQNHPDLFSLEEKVLLHHILTSSQGLKYDSDSLYYRSLSPEKLEEETEAASWRLHRLLDFGEKFEDVARGYSHDNEAIVYRGRKGWTRRGTYKHPFDSVAFALSTGEYSKPYRDEDGWHIVYVEEYQAEGLPDFDSLQYGMAYGRLMAERANALARPLVDSLSREINLEYHEAVLDTNVYFVDRWQWAAILNGIDTIDFNDIRSWEESTRKRYQVDNSTVEMKKEIIGRLAKHFVAIQAARESGVDTLPHVRSEESKLRHSRCKGIVRKGWIDPGWIASEALVEEYFQKHHKEFVPEKPLVVQHIIVEDSIIGEFVRDQAMAGIDFLQLAEEFYPGEESIRRDLANLGRIGSGDVSPEFFRVGMITRVGDVSHPVKTEYGYHVIKVLDRFDEPDVNQARSKISTLLKKQHAEEVFLNYRDDLYRRYRVKFSDVYPVHLKPVEYRIQ